jgi:kynurenine formamidase
MNHSRRLWDLESGGSGVSPNSSSGTSLPLPLKRKTDEDAGRPARQRWENRPPGANWGAFGEDDQQGRLNLITAERRRQAAREVREGVAFCLSLPLDCPGGQALGRGGRMPPTFHPLIRNGRIYFNLAMEAEDPSRTDVRADQAVLLHPKYATHWEALSHNGALFDADGDEISERVFYNGYRIVDPETGRGTQGALGATALSASAMAETCVQGRGVLVDLHRHLGDARVVVGYEQLQSIMKADGVAVEEGDILCLRTGLGRLLAGAGEAPEPSLSESCAVLDGRDPRLLKWITQSGIVAIATDNISVESTDSTELAPGLRAPGPSLPLHEHCLFKLGIHIGELWYFAELAAWLHAHGRSRFLLTAPPLRLPGATSAPACPVATV